MSGAPAGGGGARSGPRRRLPGPASAGKRRSPAVGGAKAGSQRRAAPLYHPTVASDAASAEGGSPRQTSAAAAAAAAQRGKEPRSYPKKPRPSVADRMRVALTSGPAHASHGQDAAAVARDDSSAHLTSALKGCLAPMREALQSVCIDLGPESVKRRRPSAHAWGEGGQQRAVPGSPAWLRGLLAKGDDELLSEPDAIAGLILTLTDALGKYQAAFAALPSLMQASNSTPENAVAAAGAAARCIIQHGKGREELQASPVHVTPYSVPLDAQQLVRVSAGHGGVGDAPRSARLTHSASSRRKLDFFQSSTTGARYGSSGAEGKAAPSALPLASADQPGGDGDDSEEEAPSFRTFLAGGGSGSARYFLTQHSTSEKPSVFGGLPPADSEASQFLVQGGSQPPAHMQEAARQAAWQVDADTPSAQSVALLQALLSRSPLYVDDASVDPRLRRKTLPPGTALVGATAPLPSPPSPPPPEKPERSLLALPLPSSSEKGLGSGLLALSAPVAGAFSAADVGALMAMAPAAAAAIQCAQQHQSSTHATNKAHLLMSMVQSVYRGSNYQDIITRIVDVAYELLQADRVSVFLVEGDSLVLTVSEDAAGVRIPLGKGIAGSVATTGKVLNIPDVAQDARFDPAMDKRTGYRTQSLLCMPVADRSGRVVAVIQAINKLGPSTSRAAQRAVLAFGDDDIATMQHITDTAGVVLEKAALLRAAQSATARTMAFTRVVKLVTADVTSKTFWSVLDELLRQVFVMLPAQKVTFFLVDEMNQNLQGRTFSAEEGAAGALARAQSDGAGGQVPSSPSLSPVMAAGIAAHRPSGPPGQPLLLTGISGVTGGSGAASGSSPTSSSGRRASHRRTVSSVVDVDGEFSSSEVALGADIAGALAAGTLVGPQVVKDAWKHASFDKHADVAAHFRSRTLLAVPILRAQRRSVTAAGGGPSPSNTSTSSRDRSAGVPAPVAKKKPVGVVQLVNKSDGSPFTQEDVRLIEALATEVHTLISKHGLSALYERKLAETESEGGDNKNMKSLLGMYSSGGGYAAAPFVGTRRSMDDFETSSQGGAGVRRASMARRPRGSFTAVGRTTGLLGPVRSGNNLDTLREGEGDVAAALARFRAEAAGVPGKGSSGDDSAGGEQTAKPRGSIHLQQAPGSSADGRSTGDGGAASPRGRGSPTGKRRSMPPRVGSGLASPPTSPYKRQQSPRQDVQAEHGGEGMGSLSLGSFRRTRRKSDGSVSTAGSSLPAIPTTGPGSVTSGARRARRGSAKSHLSRGSSPDSAHLGLLQGEQGATLADFDLQDGVYEWTALPPELVAAALAATPALPPTLTGRAESYESLISWSFNAFDYDKAELQQFAVDMLLHGDLAPSLHVPQAALASFISAVSHLYRDNPYHNWYHAVSVMQNVFLAVETYGVCKAVLQPVDRLAALLGGLCHDVDHPGMNNQYAINSLSPLAVRYNDKSVLENHHAAVMFQLILREPSTALFPTAEPGLLRAFRSRAVSCILNTDMAHHMTMVNFMKQMPAEPLEYWCGEDAEKAPAFWPTDIIVHCADVDNPAMPDFANVRKWALAITQEFTNQVAAEKEAGLPFAPFMDGLQPPLAFAKSQVGFSTFVIKPLFSAAAGIFSELEPVLQQLNDNVERWKSLVAAQEVAQAAVSRQATALARAKSHSVASRPPSGAATSPPSEEKPAAQAASSGGGEEAGGGESSVRSSSPSRRRHTIAMPRGPSGKSTGQGGGDGK